MKPNIINQEILLVTTTSFSKRQLCETDRKDKNSRLTPVQQLETACWNSLLDELLPEIMLQPTPHKKLYLWQMRPGFSFLQLDYGEFPLAVEKLTSIDPHNSLACMCYN